MTMVAIGLGVQAEITADQDVEGLYLSLATDSDMELLTNTNHYLAALAAGDAQDGDVHVARGQTTGRGRLGRRRERIG